MRPHHLRPMTATKLAHVQLMSMHCIGAELAEEARITCPWLEVRVLDKVGHFMQLEDPKLVNQHIVEWVTGQK